MQQDWNKSRLFYLISEQNIITQNIEIKNDFDIIDLYMKLDEYKHK